MYKVPAASLEHGDRGRGPGDATGTGPGWTPSSAAPSDGLEDVGVGRRARPGTHRHSHLDVLRESRASGARARPEQRVDESGTPRPRRFLPRVEIPLSTSCRGNTAPLTLPTHLHNTLALYRTHRKLSHETILRHHSDWAPSPRVKGTEESRSILTVSLY